MEQLYMIEIFLDKLSVYVNSEEKKEKLPRKALITKIKFGPKTQFIMKENYMAKNEDDKKEDLVETDENGQKYYNRHIRVGKSYLFPSHPDTILSILSKFPLEIELWTDDDKEEPIFVGVGNMHWDTNFFHYVKETTNDCKLHDPLSIKSKTVLYAECCCLRAGEITFIVRLSALGNSIITEFQQLMKTPEHFVFRTNKAPSMFDCKRVDGDDPNFCMIGSLYETAALEDPDKNPKPNIEVCTELQSCGIDTKDKKYRCEHGTDNLEPPRKIYPIDKIRMGDIKGPCGNTNCPLAHRVKMYIRNLDSYKAKAGNLTQTKGKTTKNVCGACVCKDDRWHRDECPELTEREKPKALCSACGGHTRSKDTCEDRKKQLFGTGFTPADSDTKVAYVFDICKEYKKGIFGRNFIVEDYYDTQYDNIIKNQNASTSQNINGTCAVYRCNNNFEYGSAIAADASNRNASNRKFEVYTCTQIPEDKDCNCDPPKPSPPCKTFDCECHTEIAEKISRKNHRPYCPSYKHKVNCPVTMMSEEDEKKDEEEDEAEPLPYGLPPIKLGPCPVMGRPCSVPDGFARMYKNALQPPLPPSYNDAGKVCCSKEFKRIKDAIKDYMKYEKDHDFRCVNKFSVDTEKRCCDKEQYLMSLMGKGCCGTHKMAIQEKFKEEDPRPPKS